MMRIRTFLSIVAVPAVFAIIASQAPAATLTESVWHILGSSDAPTSDTSHNISVHPAYGGYRGQGNVGGATVVVNESFGGATILDYGFYKANASLPGLIEAYASGASGLVGLPTTAAQGGNESHAKVWTMTDPGGYNFTNAADFTSSTVLKMATCTGTIDISGLTEGRIYFFYGAYRGWCRYDLTISGAGQTNVVVNDVGRNDSANNNEMYVVGVDFADAGVYDTITYTYLYEPGTTTRGRHIGVVLVTPSADTNAPHPSPMTWERAPTADSESSISMTADEATDPEGAPVWYLFKNLTLGTDSGWQTDRTFTDTGLSASSNYTYTVEARDQTPNRNATLPSSQESATTLTADTNAPPTPNFATEPTAISPYEITMAASVVTDPETNGVEYYFTCTSGSGTDSGWQASPAYTDSGLTPLNTYEYTVKARDTSISFNESGPSAPASATTLKLPTATLTENAEWFLFSGSPFNVSVYPGNSGFRCTDQSISKVINGTIQDYAFIKESVTPDVIETYASSGSGLLSFGAYEPRSNQSLGSGNNLDNLWTVTDPETTWTSAADYTSGTSCGPLNFLEGSIDISGFASGTVHFFYGGYRTTQFFDLTIMDTDGPETDLPLLKVGDNDFSNGNEWYSASVAFTNPTGYDKIHWTFSSSLYNALGANAPHCSLAGVVLVAEGLSSPGTVLVVR